MRMLMYLFQGLMHGYLRWDRERQTRLENEKRDKEREERFGRCGDCNVLLFYPIHETGCSQRYTLVDLIEAVSFLQMEGYFEGKDAEEIAKELQTIKSSAWPEEIKDYFFHGE